MRHLETLSTDPNAIPLPSDTDYADIAVLGRASYPFADESGEYRLALTEASKLRGQFAADIYDPEYHDRVAFGGGYPGAAQAEHWPTINGEQWVPEETEGEGFQMAVSLIDRLRAEGWDDDEINEVVKAEAFSNHTLLDVYHMVDQNHINPDGFHEDGVVRGLILGMGRKHGWRAADAFSTVLDIDPKRIAVMPDEDPYGTPASGLLPAEAAWKAHVKEDAARVIHNIAMQGVRPGDLDDLGAAADRFTEMALDPKRVLLRNPVGIVRAVSLAVVNRG